MKNILKITPSKKDLLYLKWSIESFKEICEIVKKPRDVEDRTETIERYNRIIDIVQSFEDSINQAH